MDKTIGVLATTVSGIRDDAAKGKWVDLLHAEFAVESAMTLAVIDADRIGALREEKEASDRARRAYGDAMSRHGADARATRLAQVALYKTYYPFISDATLRALLDRVIAHYEAN